MGSGRGWQNVPNAEDIPFSDDDYAATNLKDALIEGDQVALQTPVYPLILIWNGTINNGDFYGYSNVVPGDQTILTVPQASELVRYTWSNPNANADFTLIFRRGIITATPFISVPYTNTDRTSYVFASPEVFAEGEAIFIEHQDDGNNAQDVGFVLFFRALPS